MKYNENTDGRGEKSPRSVRWLILLCVLIFLAGVGGSLYVLTRTTGQQVEIVQDGEVVYSFDLSKAEDQVFEMEFEGRVNVIEISDHQIRVREADCPDQICVEMGWLDSALPITCLPNHLVIQFADAAGVTGTDAVAG